jgi:uncharacterized PurR-regulated membrane protein YhhQ (DUF165 family)
VPVFAEKKTMVMIVMALVLSIVFILCVYVRTHFEPDKLQDFFSPPDAGP